VPKLNTFACRDALFGCADPLFLTSDDFKLRYIVDVHGMGERWKVAVRASNINRIMMDGDCVTG